MPFIIASSAATRVGARHHNEDAYVAETRVFAVADGMGGHAAGEVASAIAVGALARVASLPRIDAEDVIGALQRCSDDIFVRGREHEARAGMGTTVSGIALVEGPDDQELLVFNAGDSRTYLARGGAFVQLTHDHSFVQELVDAGEIAPSAMRLHPQRNVVTRVLGTQHVEIDTFSIAPYDGDRILICSDGVTSDLSDEQLQQILDNADPIAAADLIVDAALAAGCRDNATAVVVEIESRELVPAIGSDAEDTVPRTAESSGRQASTGDNAVIEAVPFDLRSSELRLR